MSSGDDRRSERRMERAKNRKKRKKWTDVNMRTGDEMESSEHGERSKVKRGQGFGEASNSVRHSALQAAVLSKAPHHRNVIIFPFRRPLKGLNNATAGGSYLSHEMWAGCRGELLTFDDCKSVAYVHIYLSLNIYAHTLRLWNVTGVLFCYLITIKQTAVITSLIRGTCGINSLLLV